MLKALTVMKNVSAIREGSIKRIIKFTENGEISMSLFRSYAHSLLKNDKI